MAMSLVFAMLFTTFGVLTLKPQTAQAAMSFVTRSGNKLMLGGSEFKFSGTNCEGLPMNSYNGTGNCTQNDTTYYMTNTEINDLLDTAKEMGLLVIRSFACLTCGSPKSLQPTTGTWNDSYFERLDYAIKAAGDRGIRFIFPLVENYDYYYGGKGVYSSYRGGADFFTDTNCINDFKAHINTVLNRVNSYTGVAYKNDPAILAWETGNELSPPVSWTQTIADYIKSIDSNHLVMDGRYGVDPSALSLTNVDIYSNHYYPPAASAFDGNTAVRDANKVYIMGEFDAVLTQADYDRAVTSNAISGDLWWELWPHHDHFGFMKHYSAYDRYYPGKDSTMRTQLAALRGHAYAMRGLSVPASGALAAPVITNTNSYQKTIAWRGVTGADKYDVERSTAGPGGPWTLICDKAATDLDTPWQDVNRPAGTVWYRVKAYNLDGVASGYSNVYVSNTNLAVNKTVNASSSIENTWWGKGKAVDGYQYSLKQHFNVGGSLGWTNGTPPDDCGYSSLDHASAISNEWIEIDLGSNQSFNQVKLYPRTDAMSTDPNGYAANFPVDFTIQVKPDAGSYTTVNTVTGQSNPDVNPVVYDIGNQNARYIKINVTKLGSPAKADPNAYRLQLAEIEVFNTNEAGGGTNLALNKNVSVSSDNGYNLPDRAVDGNMSTFWCASNGSFPQWLKVDLGASYSLSQIKQTFADTDGSTYYYKLEGSTDNTNFTLLVDRTSSGVVGPAVTENVSGTYRYVRITITGASNGHYGSSKEFEVYGSGGGPNTSFVTSLTTGGQLRNDYGDYVGMKITVGGSPITVKELGRYFVPGNSGTHTLAIYTTGGTQLGSVSINMGSGTADSLGYKYATLPSPVTLSANTPYYIVSLESAGGDQWYGNTVYPSLSVTGVATVNNAECLYLGTWYAYGSAGNCYVPLNFKY